MASEWWVRHLQMYIRWILPDESLEWKCFAQLYLKMTLRLWCLRRCWTKWAVTYCYSLKNHVRNKHHGGFYTTTGSGCVHAGSWSALRPGCNSCCYTTKPPNISRRFHGACVTFCLSHICLCHFVTTLARLHTRLFSTHTEHADHWGPSSHGNEPSVRRVLVEIIVIWGCFTDCYCRFE